MIPLLSLHNPRLGEFVARLQQYTGHAFMSHASTFLALPCALLLSTVHSSGASDCALAASLPQPSRSHQPGALTRGVGAAALARPAPTTTVVEASSAFFLPTSSARKPHEAAPRSMPTNTDDVSRDWLVGLSKPKLQDACRQTDAGGQCV